ncbi:hypothetical protein ACSDQ9_05530 [Aestuariimicrobium soli]|uniref:hypothetical protein n=1 Tax=Aestuariimicrobium soli TaxID=2035834 RepID=UPI003EBDF22E
MNQAALDDSSPDFWAQLFGSIDAHLRWVSSLDPRGPEAAASGLETFGWATAAPSSAWALHYAYEAFGAASKRAEWQFTSNENVQRLKESTNLGLAHVRGLEPSAELDESLRAWQQSAGIEPKHYPGEAPRRHR